LRVVHYLAFGVIATALWLTASTSAWASGLCCLGLIATVATVTGSRRSGGMRLPPAALFVLLVLLVAAAGWLIYRDTASAILEERWSKRMEDPLSDLPEQLALEVLHERPIFCAFGTGLGGMSFYIAEKMAFGQRVVLFPNNGLLALVCNVGIVGLLLGALAVKNGLLTLVPGRRANPEARMLAVAGASAAVQCLIFSQTWVMALAFGLLLAAEFRSRQRAAGPRKSDTGAQARRETHLPPRRIPGEGAKAWANEC